MKKPVSRAEKIVLFCAMLTGVLLVVAFFHDVGVCREAVVRSGIARDLLSDAVEGRQGLVGSLKWPPLPTLLALPFVKIPQFGSSGFGFVILNAVVSVFTLTLLNGWWARFDIPRAARFPLLCVYQMSPPVIGAVLTGSSSTVMLLLLMAGAYFLVVWVKTLDLRSLAYLGILAGLAVVTRYQSVALVVLVTVVVIIRTLRVRRRSFRSATLLVLLIPGIYTVVLWFTANWLIMGDPVFFVRGLMGKGRLLAEVTDLNIDWYLYLMPLMLVVTAAVLARGRSRTVKPPPAIAVTLVVVLLMASVSVPYVKEFYLSDSSESYLGKHRQQVVQVDEIKRHLKDWADAKVFVSGYSGYQFVTGDPREDTFVHLMSLDLRELHRRTHGQQLFFLVPRPKGVYSWDDVNLREPWLFQDYAKPGMGLEDHDIRATFMIEKEWEDWHLIRAFVLETGN